MLRAGATEPLHARDVEAFAAARAANLGPVADAATDAGPGAAQATHAGPAAAPAAHAGTRAEHPGEVIELAASVDRAGAVRFLDWAAAEGAVPPERVWIAFATGALRAAGAAGPITVSCARGTGAALTLTDADLVPLSAGLPAASGPPALRIRDWTPTRLSDARVGPQTGVTISVFARGDALELCLAARPDALDLEGALRCLDGLAARLEDPLRQLL
jgi:hypothetical protein